MLRTIQLFVRRAYGDRLPTVGQWAEHNANRASPDQLIEAAIIQSFVSHLKDWSVSCSHYDHDYAFPETVPSRPSGASHYESDKKKWTFTRADKVDGKFAKKLVVVVTVNFTTFFRKTAGSYNTTFFRVAKGDYATVNDVPIGPEHGLTIVKKFFSLKEAVEKAEAAARMATIRMEENEKKWNLAEKLLGMKRNEFGALVPEETAYATE